MPDSLKIKVSVIITIYNSERFLRQCMESVLGQTLRDIEIICVNDGSVDKSLDILEEFAKADSRIVIYSKKNEGQGGASARNLGLEKARGEYISILDSDDFFEITMLEKAVAKADATNADIVVFSGLEYDNRNGNTYKVASILNEKVIPQAEVFSYRDIPENIYQLSQGMAWNKLYRRVFLEKHGLRFQKIKFTDDAYFTFAHMALAGRIAVLKDYLCYYRVNTGSSQTDSLASCPDSAFLPYTALKDSLVKWGIYGDVKQSFVNCSVSFLRYFYDKINRFEPFKNLHDKYRTKVFNALDISGHTPDYFYDERTYLWTAQVAENSAEELVFKAARAYGSENTTGILRFMFPYDLIPRESKIALVGAGIMGRHYYAQIMLQGWCDVVVWAETKNPFRLSYIRGYEELKNVRFDFALVAYADSELAGEAVSYLAGIGVAREKIIFGGTF